MKPLARSPLVVDIGPLREIYYTGIPNVIAEICSRLLQETWLDLYFDLDGRWIDTDDLRRCLDERSGQSLGRAMERFRPAEAICRELVAAGTMAQAVALYTDHRPPRKLFPREGKLVYDLSMILTPECHPAESVRMYTSDLEEQIACSDVLFCISQATARDLAWIYDVPPERLKVIPLGNTVGSTWSHQLSAVIGERPIEPYLLVLGSIEPRKNAAFVLEWLARHPKILEEVRVLFVGRQAWGDSFASLIAAKSLEPAVARRRILHSGFVSETEKGVLLAGATALLYPSIFEGFGLPLLEALTLGTPVLASASTSMPEVAGSDAYYFDPCSIETLNAAFERFWADRASGKLAERTLRAQQNSSRFSYDGTYAAVLAGLFPQRSDQSSSAT